MDCARCKNFGGTHLHALLQPIVRRHPFELLVGDYLSLPDGVRGFKTVGLYLDTASQTVCRDKFKTAGSAKTTNFSLDKIFNTYAPFEGFMADQGSHFNNKEVREFCAKWGVKHHVVAAYSPWINGLVEGTNKLLLYVLARLCAPEVGEDGWDAMDWEDLPRTWPQHFDEAINILNWRILPSRKLAPKEIMLGMVVNTAKIPLEESASVLPADAIERHMEYACQQRLDAHSEAVKHAERRKKAFDRKVLQSGAGEVVFEEGELVQLYRSKLAGTLSVNKKIQPMWTGPYRVRERMLNSYHLETIAGDPLEGAHNAQRLRRFTAREGTQLAADQASFLAERRAREVEAADEVEGTAVSGPVAIEVERQGQEATGDEEAEEEEPGLVHHNCDEQEGIEEDKGGEEGLEANLEANDVDSESKSEDLGGVARRVAARRRGRRH